MAEFVTTFLARRAGDEIFHPKIVLGGGFLLPPLLGGQFGSHFCLVAEKKSSFRSYHVTNNNSATRQNRGANT